VNYQSIPANCPLKAFNPFQRDGAHATHNYGATPNYQSSFHPITYKPATPHTSPHERWVGAATNFVSTVTDCDYEQANGLWNVLGRTPGQQDNFVYNVSVHLKDARPEVQEKTFGMFTKVNAQLGKRIREATAQKVKEAAAERAPVSCRL
jgi:catalase